MSENINKKPEIITLSSYPKAILHIDCDAFFASCEQARDPGIKGRAVVTGKERGIVSCPSYEAKAAGVKRGMRIFEARRACPGLIILPSDYETYSIYSERMFAILRRFTPDVEPFSIDEAYCDITGLRRLHHGSYAGIACAIKEAVREELGITVSVGLSATKTLAKIASKYKKPDGFTEVPGDRIHEFLALMPLEKVCGFGPNTVELLTRCGMRYVLDFVKRPEAYAKKLLGKIGGELWHELRGEMAYPVSALKEEKHLTISKTKTFAPPSGDRDVVKGHLIRNLESACIKLRRHRLSARGVSAYLRTEDYRGSGMEAVINRHSSSTLDFTGLAGKIFDGIFREGTRYRATGVVLFGIGAAGFDRHDLFEDPVKIERSEKIGATIDDINCRYGKHAIHLAASDNVRDRPEHERNELPWRRNSVLKGETPRRRLAIPLLKLKAG